MIHSPSKVFTFTRRVTERCENVALARKILLLMFWPDGALVSQKGCLRLGGFGLVWSELSGTCSYRESMMNYDQ